MKSVLSSRKLAVIACITVFSLGTLGAQRTESRHVADFDVISLETSGVLEIVQGDEEYLSIAAPPEMLARISATVRNGTLHIGYRGIFTGKTAVPVFTLGMKNVKGILAAASGDIVSAGIVTRDLTIEASSSGKIDLGALEAGNVRVLISSSGRVSVAGARVSRVEASLTSRGDLTIEGAAGELSLRGTSSGSFMGESLKTGSASILLSSSGSATVWVADRLDARISGKGSVRYFGEPVTGVRVSSGSGGISGLGAK